jgi:membrane-bound lytic murein transglycosylase B
LCYSLFSSQVLAQDDLGRWLEALKQEALVAKISEPTVTATINHIELLPNILKLDLAQPEFISPFLDYYQKRVDIAKIVRGRELLVKYEYLLNQIEDQYGIPKSLLVAFWGMETNYGSHQGDVDTISALATLAYDGRRSEFFRDQLLDAMRILDAGYINLDQFHGSWAGAFGNMQFMPSTFMIIELILSTLRLMHLHLRLITCHKWVGVKMNLP